MNKHSPFEEHIKKQFEHYTPDMPPHIWENILNKKEKKRPVGFWFNLLDKKWSLLLIGILLTATGIIYRYYPLPKTENIAAPVNRLSAGIHTSTEEFGKASPIKNLPAENSLLNETIAGAVVSENKLLKQPITSTLNTQNVAPQENQTGESGTASNRSGKTKTLNAKAAFSFKKSEASGADILEFVTTDAALAQQLLELNPITTDKHTLQTVIKHNKHTQLDIPCPEAEKNSAGNKRYFEWYAGPDYAFRSITDTGNSDYARIRKESTRYSSAYSAGMRYTRVFSNGMSFRTGVNYSQINERFRHAQGNVYHVVYITNNSGDTTGSYTTTGTRYKTTMNKYRTIDIPLVIGYEMGNGRIHANFNAGAVVNIYSWQNGELLDTAGVPVNISTGKVASPYQFKTNAGIGFLGAVSVYYKLSEKWHFLAEPYFRYNFSAANKSEITLKQKYTTVGLKLGLRYDF